VTRRLAWIALIAVLAGSAAGCGDRFEKRTGKYTLQRAMSRAFKRNYAAAYRMTTNHAFRLIVRHADVRCRPIGKQPENDSEAWPWFCRVRYYWRKDPRAHIATYGVRVGALGCFEARSGAFVDRLPERVLGNRLASNPLVYIRSCP
jgi:hypothetical protein